MVRSGKFPPASRRIRLEADTQRRSFPDSPQVECGAGEIFLDFTVFRILRIFQIWDKLKSELAPWSRTLSRFSLRMPPNFMT